MADISFQDVFDQRLQIHPRKPEGTYFESELTGTQKKESKVLGVVEMWTDDPERPYRTFYGLTGGHVHG
ncbi:hypothetical protein EP56_01810 [Listeriaceae bacterium FSL A5-0209]|nr:hypothetical protein EP56_01810 [Listeriaceae bacterium FSL A5-0209]